jgi:hypothetical protein
MCALKDMICSQTRESLTLCRFETRNLLVTKKDDLNVIGKAEGLKVMLVEWMRRHDSEYRYFSDPKYSYGRSRGDITEVMKRRTWNEVPIWISDSAIQFSTPSKTTQQGDYVRNEYIYIGRTLPGTLKIDNITVRGAHASFFSVSPTNGSIGQYSSLRIKVSYNSATPLNGTRIGAFLDIRTSEQRLIARILWPA